MSFVPREGVGETVSFVPREGGGETVCFVPREGSGETKLTVSLGAGHKCFFVIPPNSNKKETAKNTHIFT